MRAEEKLHFAVADYVKLAYPDVIFISDSSGVRVSPGTAKKLKRTRSNHTHIDIYFLEPRKGKCGLFLELKAVDIYQKKNPELFLKSDHVNDQDRTIKMLNKKHYKACFAIKFDQAKQIIDEYLNDN
jgi:hypothetical protein